MTRIPDLGEYTTASGTTATITRIGKHRKWAFDALGGRWHVQTGIYCAPVLREMHLNPAFDITGRVEPDRPDPNWIFSADAAPIEAELERVTAALGRSQWINTISNDSRWVVTRERDEAVALLRRWLADGWHEQDATRAFLAKIGGGKP